MKRLFVEKKPGFRTEAASILQDIQESLRLPGLAGLRILQRYDIEGLDDTALAQARSVIFSEPPVDDIHDDTFPHAAADTVFAVEYLPGQFDQRADSAAQCVQILTQGERPKIASARVFVLQGQLDDNAVARIKKYLINPVDSREASLAVPETLSPAVPEPEPVPSLDTFNAGTPARIRAELGLAMSEADVAFCQNYFRETEGRAPTLTEIRVLDTYWSDHCRHTTFLTKLENVTFDDTSAVAPLKAAWELYLKTRRDLGRESKDVCLMDLATIAARALKKSGQLDDLEESEEINAASIVVPVEIENGTSVRTEEWLVMFKNETHNHPTEIEPFGGAATCLGGAIRDPLSGRSYVYQAMRVTGAADPRTPFEETLPGKLPQRKITRGAAHGYSSYGNQIGLATGLVAEVYHPGFVAKRMEIGAVVAAGPRENVVRGTPVPGDVIVLVGGRTGRDGIGGATGSSKEHTETALQNSAEVQKGDAPTERKLQRLFRDPAVSKLIKRCNDFGAGGVSVAIGELAPSLDIDLDAVPRKYDGLNGTELAISESQERMAVVLDPADVAQFRAAAARENAETAVVARVTDTGFLRMTWRGQTIVSLRRDFLDTNGVKQTAAARIVPTQNPAWGHKGAEDVENANFQETSENGASDSSKDTDKNTTPLHATASPRENVSPDPGTFRQRWLDALRDLNACSQRGLGERFDASIGAATVLHPFGGKHQITPVEAMAAKLPVLDGETDACTLMAHGYNPDIACASPFAGAVCAVVDSVARIVAAGGDPSRIRLTFQEYFEKLGNDPVRWGKPLAALLGAFKAQMALGLPAIGGKDSMSGSFKNLDVPPTLASFAIVPAKAGQVISPEFKKAGSAIVLVHNDKFARASTDEGYAQLRHNLAGIHACIQSGLVLSARTIRQGGIGVALAEMGFGNGLGAEIQARAEEGLFSPRPGDMLLEIEAGKLLTFFSNFDEIGAVKDADVIGRVTSAPEMVVLDVDSGLHSNIFDVESGMGAEKRHPVDRKKILVRIPLAELQNAWESPLESTFPTKAGEPHVEPAPSSASKETAPTTAKTPRRAAAPRVIIPVFPGNNCEYDTARAFREAGAVPQILVIRNQSARDVNDSLRELAGAIRSSQILMIPGGFSAGDEPDGSGKFIAAAFRNPAVRDATMDLLRNRDGLALGICNGFQALIKLGLVPHGEIRDITPDCPTLFHNRIGRHISRYARTVVNAGAVARSPWLSKMQPGDIHTIPFSHGEGQFVASPEVLSELRRNGQIAFQYCDFDGAPSGAIDFNPNGSIGAVEGIISPCGRVLGKMGHTERRGVNVAKNIPGNKHQPLFEGGVDYFR
ncbi:MAG: phosphoribosylformylglycinamidine synthase subunit PurQ [Puniceicoccales bacterium]|jgi:phosphoribosylformylglycinamidine synthase|nr:phosphoribosylformylglycinamidine synthase subunit PurQ [Puniceicoccales bacterium]